MSRWALFCFAGIVFSSILEAVQGRPGMLASLAIGSLLGSAYAAWFYARRQREESRTESTAKGRLALRKRLGAREDETMGAFLERLATMAGVVPAEVHERGWQWRPTATDTAFAPPFGTIRQCRVCGCLVAGGPTACARCAEVGA